MNESQSNEMEKIQKRCLKIIYGYEHDYETLLQLSGLEKLQERREKTFTKFAKKTSENTKYMHWFPKNPIARTGRNTLQYKEDKAIGNKLYNSPIYTMRRILNNSIPEEQVDLTGLFNTP